MTIVTIKCDKCNGLVINLTKYEDYDFTIEHAFKCVECGSIKRVIEDE